MPTISKAAPTSQTNYWTNREAYLLALVCLMAGLLIGYIFHGSAAPVNPVVASTPAGAAIAAPAQPAPSVKDLEPLAGPLLMKLKVNPKDSETLIQLGNLYYDHQLFADSVPYYTRALEAQPKNVNVRTDMGTAYWYSGFPDKAVAEYEKSLTVDPNHANTLFNLGIVRLEGLSDAAGALRAFEKLLASNPNASQRERALELMARARQRKASL